MITNYYTAALRSPNTVDVLLSVLVVLFTNQIDCKFLRVMRREHKL